jgi:glycerol-3-phosphate dehydrogenase (NAD(P)+)
MRVAVFGGGSWGTAIAVHLTRAGHDVKIWLREEELVREIHAHRENRPYLPGIALPPGLEATTDLAEAADEVVVAFVVIPSQFCREIYHVLPEVLPRDAWLVSATKGIETETLKRMSEVAADEAPDHPLAVLSGPSFALEVAQSQPTAVVVASEYGVVAEGVQRALSTRTFRVYSSQDVIGVELAGALKNVIAIAAGIVDGLGHGQNTAAALITRGLAEITRLAVALGGQADTLAGLAGLGDLVLTCTGALSRNRRLGQCLGRGMTLSEATASLGGSSSRSGAPARPMVAEGVRTTLAACALADKAGIEMPIASTMKAVLYEGKAPVEAVDGLMSRSLKRE